MYYYRNVPDQLGTFERYPTLEIGIMWHPPNECILNSTLYYVRVSETYKNTLH